mgnify:CR=1 FL=1
MARAVLFEADSISDSEQVCVEERVLHSVIDTRMLTSFFFQAEDGIRDAQESRGLGDVYKRQALTMVGLNSLEPRP